jgi:hypothetical protein
LKKHRLPLLFALACAAMIPAVGRAVTAVAISNTEDLAFGKFAAGSGGTVAISATGVRSASGGVILVTSATGAAAKFTVSGDPNLTYSISLPADGTIMLTSGAQTMALKAFSSSPSGIGQLSAGGTQTLSVGATLTVGGSQTTGSYSGAFDVTVDYN